ncbi:MAG TPA: DUF2937 family protein [Rhodocyclaceae bacterium]|nr:DUF2937 family protein [Rhodocyclaceae bacterium]
MLYRYFLIAIASAAMLLGIQIPNFIDQYQKRLDAHLIEVTENLRGFQEIANKYHQGSLEALIKEHEESASQTFRGEAVPIRAMYERYKAFRGEQSNMNTNLAGKIVHVMFGRNRQLLDETVSNYSFNIPLNQEAVLCGAIFAAVGLIIMETLVKFVVWSIGMTFGSSTSVRRTA